nr:MAG TPA: hypothetical protein [Caudoviricetes sp.]DAU07238.1 MAG TPA: hypothetical protein [Caudoviricetes sp.]DAU41356.1 MAG TPA: hypothetical protein [Bacteriophage sp.]
MYSSSYELPLGFWYIYSSFGLIGIHHTNNLISNI